MAKKFYEFDPDEPTPLLNGTKAAKEEKDQIVFPEWLSGESDK